MRNGQAYHWKTEKFFVYEEKSLVGLTPDDPKVKSATRLLRNAETQKLYIIFRIIKIIHNYSLKLTRCSDPRIKKWSVLQLRNRPRIRFIAQRTMFPRTEEDTEVWQPHQNGWRLIWLSRHHVKQKPFSTSRYPFLPFSSYFRFVLSYVSGENYMKK